jgi:hypothetical protein
VSQDERSEADEFLDGVDGVDVFVDEDLLLSDDLGIETVPTFVLADGNHIVAIFEGWLRSGVRDLLPPAVGAAVHFADLPEHRPGCGARNQDPQIAPRLRVRRDRLRLSSRRLAVAPTDDVQEFYADLGLTDGLPIVPPSEGRVLAMLDGTSRRPEEIVATVPPSLAEVSVEKVAINAVMAGCRPEHLPVVLAAVGAACTDQFNMHGVLCTTASVGPIILVNGPIRERAKINSRDNVLGQGWRANLSIGRALQLVVRNVGGGRPGQIDKSVFGNPGKTGWCFAEDEENSPWAPFHVRRGFAPVSSTVSLFAGEGPRFILDQTSIHPESLSLAIADAVVSVAHPKLGFTVPVHSGQPSLSFDVMIIVSPQHRSVFANGGWSVGDVQRAVFEHTRRPVRSLLRGAGGHAEGVLESTVDPAALAGVATKLHDPSALHVVAAGGDSGLMTALIGGWQRGAEGSELTTREVMV